MGSPKDWSERSTRTFLICCHFLCNSSARQRCLVFYLFKSVFFLFLCGWILMGECTISVRYGAGRGGFSLARPRPYTGPGGYVSGDPRPAPIWGHPHSFPGRGPVCYHLFLTGTRLGYRWCGGMRGDRSRECRKRNPAPGH